MSVFFLPRAVRGARSEVGEAHECETDERWLDEGKDKNFSPRRRPRDGERVAQKDWDNARSKPSKIKKKGKKQRQRQ